MLSPSMLYSLLFLGSVTGIPLRESSELSDRSASFSQKDKPAVPKWRRDGSTEEWSDFAVPGQKRAINPIYAAEAEYKPHGSSVTHQVSTIEQRQDADDWADFAVPGEKRAINPIYAEEAEYKPHGSKASQEGNAPKKRVEGLGLLDVVVRAVEDENDWRTWTAPSAINPIYLNVSHEDVYKRAESGPIYGSSGKPNIKDVHQTTNPSCGFASVMAAVANANPDWIATHVTYSPNAAGANNAKVSLYDKSAPKEFSITCAETAQKSDVDASTGIWWPGAYDHAGVKLGLPNSNGAMGPILPGTSLEAITGKKATGNLRITADAIFDLAVKSASAKTPAILQTKGDNVRTLVGNHAYTLLSGEGTGAGRKITLYNPWGSYVTASLDTIAPETYALWHLENFDSFSGGGGGGVVTTEPPPKTTQQQQEQPKPQPTSSAQGGGGGGGGDGASRSRGGWRTKGRGRKTANPEPTQVEPKKEENVVWVTEVVTVYVNA